MSGDEEAESQETQKTSDCSFEWDDQSQLYFHASSGFYHDPNAGWYLSSRDGLYYKFDNGTYVPLQPPPPDCIDSAEPENPPPPSEWLEETLINLYLAGYSNSAINGADDRGNSMNTDVGCSGAVDDDTEEVEEGEWILEDLQDTTASTGTISNEVTSWDEENWRAQYGQVIQTEEEEVPAFPIIDLWDWAMVTETVEKKRRGQKKKCQVARLVGKLLKPSTKLHPSMPSGGVLFKTATISEVHLSLVRVSSGQVYRLKSPSLKYISSLSTYDSSNPTKGWRFSDLSIDKQGTNIPSFGESCLDQTSGVHVSKGSFALSDQLPVLEKNKGCAYRDRAAERRALHGGYGVGPGQKRSGDDIGRPSSPVSDSTEEAAAEALNMSFGAGSFARKILKSMGWKEGEALGKTMKGLLRPLEAVGNKGQAGLGWNQRRPDHT